MIIRCYYCSKAEVGSSDAIRMFGQWTDVERDWSKPEHDDGDHEYLGVCGSVQCQLKSKECVRT